MKKEFLKINKNFKSQENKIKITERKLNLEVIWRFLLTWGSRTPPC